MVVLAPTPPRALPQGADDVIAVTAVDQVMDVAEIDVVVDVVIVEVVELVKGTVAATADVIIAVHGGR